MRIWIKNLKYDIHIIIIRLLKTLRTLVGKINAKRIDTNQDVGIIKIPMRLIKWLGCTTPDDVYIVMGIYDALIKTGLITGYTHLGINFDTDEKILNILRSNYKWNEQTMWGDIRAIEFTWYMTTSPIRFISVKENIIVWSKEEDIRNVCDF